MDENLDPLMQIQSPSMTQSALTLQMARTSIRRLCRRLSCLTSETVAVGEAIDRTQTAIDKKCKELRLLRRRVNVRKRELEKLTKKRDKAWKAVDKVAVRGKKYENPATPQSGVTDGINTTFATEDLFIISTSEAPAHNSRTALGEISTENVPYPRPSSRKRKRFAGIWDDIENNNMLSNKENINNTNDAIHDGKRIRMEAPSDVTIVEGVIDSNKEKEGSMPESESELMSSPHFASTPMMLGHDWGEDDPTQ